MILVSPSALLLSGLAALGLVYKHRGADGGATGVAVHVATDVLVTLLGMALIEVLGGWELLGL